MSLILKVECPVCLTRGVVPSAWDGRLITCHRCREDFVAGLPRGIYGSRVREAGVPQSGSLHSQELEAKLRRTL